MDYLARAFQGSLRARLIYLCSTMALLAAFIVGGMYHLRASEQATSRAVDALAASARLASLQLAAPFTTMRHDVISVSRTPPISGIIRASRDDGIDAEDGSTFGQWRHRLEAIFESVMRERPYYTQMRYIGMADGGREIVRVNRLGSAFERVGAIALQQKADRPYFHRARELGRGRTAFSEVSLNIEHGRVEGTGVATVRALVPVFAEDGERFGFIIINSNIEMMLRHAMTSLDLPQDVYVAFRDGSYLVRTAGGSRAADADGGWSAPVFHRARSADFSPVVNDMHRSDFQGGVLVFEDGVAAVAPLKSRRFGEELGVALALFEANGSLFAGAKKLANEMTLLGIALTVAVTFLAGALARRLLQPLSDVTATLLREDVDDLMHELPVDRVDEIGALSRALTQRAEAQKASEAKAQVVLEHASEGIITIDSNGMIESFNNACASLFGYSAAEAVGRNVSFLMPAEHRSKHNGYIRRFLEQGKSPVMGARRDMRGQRKGGEIFPIELTVMDVEIGGRLLITGIVRDITERVASEAERDALIDKLAQSNKELEAFAYVASHDLKAPLRTIDNAARWIEEDISDHLDEETRENLDLLKNRVSRMDKLLDDLLAYSRIGAKEEASVKDRVSGDELLEDVLALQTRRPGFVIEYSDAFCGITVNRMPLQQVFHNLIGNAIKHHHRNTGWIEVGVVDCGDHYRFSVRDDGPGIPEGFQTQVFEMFQTLKPRDQVEGSGMGLAMVRKHVQLAGGEIFVRSKEGEGSEFIFTWRKPMAIDGGKPDVDAVPGGETRFAAAG